MRFATLLGLSWAVDPITVKLTHQKVQHKRLEATQPSYLDNLNNLDQLVYTCPLYFGNPWQGLSNDTFILDTTAGWTTVNSVLCTNCPYREYNQTASSSYKTSTYTESSAEVFVNRKMVMLYGHAVIDQVALNNPQTVKQPQFNFLSINSTDPTFNYTGVLGLGNPSNTSQQKYNFMQAMQFTVPTLALSLSFDSSESVAIFGGTNSSLYTGSLVEHQTNPVTGFLSVFNVLINSISFGNTTIMLNSKSGIIASSSSMIIMGTKEYAALTTIIMSMTNDYYQGFNCSLSQCFNDVACGYWIDQFQNLTFYIDLVPYVITPEGYLQTIDDKCVVLISSMTQQESQDTVILGNTFLKNFYVELSYSSPYSVFLANTIYSPPSIPLIYSPPLPSFQFGTSFWHIFLVTWVSQLSCIIVVTIIAVVLYQKKNGFIW